MVGVQFVASMMTAWMGQLDEAFSYGGLSNRHQGGVPGVLAKLSYSVLTLVDW